METFDEIKKIWNEPQCTKQATPNISENDILQIVKTRVKNEKKILSEYFWASFFYQSLIYGFMVFLVMRHINDPQILLLSVSGIVLYLPFTFVFIRKYKAMFLQQKRSDLSENDMYLNIQTTYKRLVEFYRFKKRFDWVGVPVSCFLIVAITFKLYVPGSFEENQLASSLLFLAWIAAFIIALWYENKKKFAAPIQQLEIILNEFR